LFRSQGIVSGLRDYANKKSPSLGGGWGFVSLVESRKDK